LRNAGPNLLFALCRLVDTLHARADERGDERREGAVSESDNRHLL